MPESRRAWRTAIKATARVLLGVGLLLLLWQRGLVDPVRLTRALTTHPRLCLCAFVLQGAVLATMGMRWRILSRPSDLFLGKWESIRLTLVALAFSNCLPGNSAGDLAKAWILTRRKVPFAKTLGTMAVDRWTGITGLFLSWTFWTSLLVVEDPRARAIGVVLLVLAGGGAVLSTAICLFGHSLIRFVPFPTNQAGWWGRLAGTLRSVLDTAARSGANRPAILTGVLLSCCTHQMMIAIGWCCVHIVDIHARVYEIGALLPASMIANSLPLSPGGVGLGESVGALGFARLGYPAWTGSETLLLVRLAAVAWALPGLVVWLATRDAPKS
jgi:hypothetical protein